MSIRFEKIPAGADFSVPADADGVIYTKQDDGSVTADGMETMDAATAQREFGDAECIVNALRVA